MKKENKAFLGNTDIVHLALISKKNLQNRTIPNKGLDTVDVCRSRVFRNESTQHNKQYNALKPKTIKDGDKNYRHSVINPFVFLYIFFVF